MKKINLLIACIAIIGFTACEPVEKEDVVKSPGKDGSIETVLTVTHENGFDLLTTTHKVWYKGMLDKSIVKHDTLRNLGFTVQEGENSDGETKHVSVPKDYEFYITVK